MTLASLCWFGGIAAMSTAFVSRHARRVPQLHGATVSWLRAGFWSAVISAAARPGTMPPSYSCDGQRHRHHGAAMILIRPLIRANIARQHNTHVFVFFIILVDVQQHVRPPLFVGFLHGVDFFWTTRHLLPQTSTRGRPAARNALCTGYLAVPCRTCLRSCRTTKPDQVVASSTYPYCSHRRCHSAVRKLANLGVADRFWHQARTAKPEVATRRCCSMAFFSWLTRTSTARRTGSPGSRSGSGRKLPRSSPPSSPCWPHSREEGLLCMAVVGGDRSDGTPHEVAYFWYTGLMSAFSKTMRRPISCSSSFRAATRSGTDGRIFWDLGRDLDAGVPWGP